MIRALIKKMETISNKKVFLPANNLVRVMFEYWRPNIVENIMANDKNKYKQEFKI